LVLCFACQKEDKVSSMMETSSQRFAWTAELPTGGRVVLEPLEQPHVASEARNTEETMLRARLSLPEDMALLRLHRLRMEGDLPSLGKIRAGVQLFLPFGSPPAHMAPLPRLVWMTVLQGERGAMEVSQNISWATSIFWGESMPRQASHEVFREYAGAAIPLEYQVWSEQSRRDFLDFINPPPAHESP